MNVKYKNKILCYIIIGENCIIFLYNLGNIRGNWVYMYIVDVWIVNSNTMHYAGVLVQARICILLVNKFLLSGALSQSNIIIEIFMISTYDRVLACSYCVHLVKILYFCIGHYYGRMSKYLNIWALFYRISVHTCM